GVCLCELSLPFIGDLAALFGPDRGPSDCPFDDHTHGCTTCQLPQGVQSRADAPDPRPAPAFAPPSAAPPLPAPPPPSPPPPRPPAAPLPRRLLPAHLSLRARRTIRRAAAAAPLRAGRPQSRGV